MASGVGQRVRLVEVFSSVQGEGLHVGETTLFVRFGDCDLRCAWCDSPGTWEAPARWQAELVRGGGRREDRDNPARLADVVEVAERLDVGRHRFVSLTGGEPLLQPEAVAELARTLRTRGPRIHLETHGLLHDALTRVLDTVDVVAMDWKLASDVRRASDPRQGPVPTFHEAHETFLRVARQAPEVVVKVVVTPHTRDDELDAVAEAVARVDPETPLVLQPVTPFGRFRETAPPERLLAWVIRLSRRLADVRLIPQTHKGIGVD